MDTKTIGWIMPGWMEKYREHICNTGGNSVEELLNNHDDTLETNMPIVVLRIAVESQIGLLVALRGKGLLKD